MHMLSVVAKDISMTGSELYGQHIMTFECSGCERGGGSGEGVASNLSRCIRFV